MRHTTWVARVDSEDPESPLVEYHRLEQSAYGHLAAKLFILSKEAAENRSVKASALIEARRGVRDLVEAGPPSSGDMDIVMRRKRPGNHWSR